MATAINNHHHAHAAPQHYSRGNSSSTSSNGASATHTSSNNSAQSHQSLNAPTSVARRGLSSPPSLLNARIFARLTAGYAQEQKMAELRAAYASPPTAYSSSASANATPNGRRNAGPSRASLPFVATTNAANTAILPTSATTAVDLFMENGGGQKSGISSTSSSRRGSAVANCLPTPSLMDLAASAGLLSLSPSDLVFESSVLGIAYYDFILSVSEVTSNGGNNMFGGGTSFSSSSCSSTTTIKENPATKMETSPGGKRRVRPTGSEPTPAMSAREPEKGGPAAMLFKLDKQRPGTSMGINNERKGSTQTTHSATTETSVPTVKIASDTEINNQQNSNSSTFSNCNYRLFLAKLDSHTNVEWFESVIVPGELLERNAIPVNELSLLTMGILIWRSRLTNSRLLCLANGQLGEDSTTALEALKRAANKYKCMHHVLTIGQRRQSASSTHSSCSTSSYRSSSSCGSYGQSQDSGMKLRVLMCQSRNELSAVPSQALRDAKFLMAPTTNPLLCLCFPLT